MKNKLVLTGLASALVVSVVSALSTSQANQTSSEINNATAAESAPSSDTKEGKLDDTESTSDQADAPEAVKVGESQPTQQVSDQAAIAKIHTYEKDDRPAATLYIKNIPVVTFLGSDQADADAAKVATSKSQQPEETTETSQDPVWRATTVAATINQLDREGIEASTIQVEWDKQRQSYVIKTDAAHILEMSELTILPKTTQDMGDDALKITNLMRRQMGNADPLQEVAGRPQPPAPVVAAAPSTLYQVNGEASWYGPGFHGNQTANGEIYDQYAMTAAHKTLPFGTQVRVTNLYNGRSVVVRINDRGPYIPGRIIDLSLSAAQTIGMSGVADVQMDILQ